MKKGKENMEYNLVICGGTFDHLHTGHKMFLRFAFSKGRKVIIGITSDKYIQQYKKNQLIEPFVCREKAVVEFLEKEGFLSRAKVVAIDSRFDQTHITDTNLVALLVSDETYGNGLEINKERKEHKLPPLPILIFPLVKDSTGEKISSTQIRLGQTNRKGIVFPDKTLFIAPKMRELLHKPFGQLIVDDIPPSFLADPGKIVTVGDVTTKRLHDLHIQQKLSVVDFHIERMPTHKTLKDLGFLSTEKILTIANPAGQLSEDLWQKTIEFVESLPINNNAIIVVEGEEDLFVIPLILMLPLGFVLFYGQPAYEKNDKKGVVIVKITESLKEQTYELLRQFESSKH
ncbi:MAG TPA: pantetheine-phosphate adenylyltransferase [Patescibacteria group bacterium]|nr:pantetheine-phosphate adenylyltransferase [Patescibacteria group bacterium]